ncbi:hypothetical protein [Lewinella cohaerens]|nr:hypothetical protein [Lewinella cohaerens]
MQPPIASSGLGYTLLPAVPLLSLPVTGSPPVGLRALRSALNNVLPDE